VIAVTLNKCVHVPKGRFVFKTLLHTHTLIDVFDDVHQGGRPSEKLFAISAASTLHDCVNGVGLRAGQNFEIARITYENQN
jgi:hypothetical protein